MLNSDSLQFLYDLSQNNNREWFTENKKRYEKTTKKPFEAFVSALIDRIKKFEPAFQTTAKDSIFRIYRDTRFSSDKTPYKTHLSAVFTSHGRKTMQEPGYYFQISFGSLSIGGGAYFLEKEQLAKVRQAIAKNPKAFRKLIEAAAFTEKFGEIKGEKNKILPAEIKQVAVAEPLLFNKQFYYMTEIDPEIVLQPDAIEAVAAYFEAGKPLNDFFRKALGSL
ncbi:MAG: DUF2461 domain-containing protein [Lewinellaceae bacterium]|nr:DUF2461 domain-containing protein [Saprospiraceae bacterium]MCB9315070.1 DUF2461 domain-containing protein [Lewinellaceae bacterium]MCB9329857.1 DUF2461 domain-containing protein [Lewinellaceae bacterium]